MAAEKLLRDQECHELRHVRHHPHHHHHLVNGTLPSPPFSTISTLSNVFNNSDAAHAQAVFQAHLFATYAAANSSNTANSNRNVDSRLIQVPLPLSIGVASQASHTQSIPAQHQLRYHHATSTNNIRPTSIFHQHTIPTNLSPSSQQLNSTSLRNGEIDGLDLISNWVKDHQLFTGDKTLINEKKNIKKNEDEEINNGFTKGKIRFINGHSAKNRSSGQIQQSTTKTKMLSSPTNPIADVNLLKQKQSKSLLNIVSGKNKEKRIKNTKSTSKNEDGSNIEKFNEKSTIKEEGGDGGRSLLIGTNDPNFNNNNQEKYGNATSRDKLFTCQVCNRCFGYKHVLQNHERIHTGEKPFECNICQKKFTRDHHLKTHMRLHTGEKPYQCPNCDRQFVQVANLRRHLRVHTGEKPYGCDYCKNRFSDSNQLKAHMLIHKGEKPHTCNKCDGKFRRPHHLRHHKCIKDTITNSSSTSLTGSSTNSSRASSSASSPSSTSSPPPNQTTIGTVNSTISGLGGIQLPSSSYPSNVNKRERKSKETRRIIRIDDLNGNDGNEFNQQLLIEKHHVENNEKFKDIGLNLKIKDHAKGDDFNIRYREKFNRLYTMNRKEDIVKEDEDEEIPEQTVPEDLSTNHLLNLRDPYNSSYSTIVTDCSNTPSPPNRGSFGSNSNVSSGLYSIGSSDPHSYSTEEDDDEEEQMEIDDEDIHEYGEIENDDQL